MNEKIPPSESPPTEKTMSRRDFLKRAIVGAAALLIETSQAQKGHPFSSEKPDFLTAEKWEESVNRILEEIKNYEQKNGHYVVINEEKLREIPFFFPETAKEIYHQEIHFLDLLAASQSYKAREARNLCYTDKNLESKESALYFLADDFDFGFLDMGVDIKIMNVVGSPNARIEYYLGDKKVSEAMVSFMKEVDGNYYMTTAGHVVSNIPSQNIALSLIGTGVSMELPDDHFVKTKLTDEQKKLFINKGFEFFDKLPVNNVWELTEVLDKAQLNFDGARGISHAEVLFIDQDFVGLYLQPTPEVINDLLNNTTQIEKAAHSFIQGLSDNKEEHIVSCINISAGARGAMGDSGGGLTIKVPDDIVLEEGKVVKEGTYVMGAFSNLLYNDRITSVATDGQVLLTSRSAVLVTNFNTPTEEDLRPLLFQ